MASATQPQDSMMTLGDRGPATIQPAPCWLRQPQPGQMSAESHITIRHPCVKGQDQLVVICAGLQRFAKPSCCIQQVAAAPGNVSCTCVGAVRSWVGVSCTVRKLAVERSRWLGLACATACGGCAAVLIHAVAALAVETQMWLAQAMHCSGCCRCCMVGAHHTMCRHITCHIPSWAVCLISWTHGSLGCAVAMHGRLMHCCCLRSAVARRVLAYWGPSPLQRCFMPQAFMPG
jgi:hypothetical protein